jgi:hypothetical protein
MDMNVPSYSMDQLHKLVGFQDVWDFERRHAGENAKEA